METMISWPAQPCQGCQHPPVTSCHHNMYHLLSGGQQQCKSNCRQCCKQQQSGNPQAWFIQSEVIHIMNQMGSVCPVIQEKVNIQFYAISVLQFSNRYEGHQESCSMEHSWQQQERRGAGAAARQGKLTGVHHVKKQLVV